MIITKQLVLTALHYCKVIGGDEKDSEVETKATYIHSSKTDAEALIYLDHELKILFLIGKGSKEFRDFVYDAKFRKDTIGWNNDLEVPIRVHTGFNETELSINHDIQRVINTMYPFDLWKHYKIIAAGHSLGKSITELAVYRSEIPFHAVIGFGGAHTGDAGFSLSLKYVVDDNIQFRNKEDLVPKLLEGKFKYVSSGTVYLLEDQHKNKLPPANIPAAMVNHDLVRDYEGPINSLPMKLNDSIFSSLPAK